MFDPRYLAGWYKRAIDAVPFADRESQRAKMSRIADAIGVSRSKLYMVLDGKATKGISLEGAWTLLDMIGPESEARKRELVSKLVQALGLKLE